MKYDLDCNINRVGTESSKWNCEPEYVDGSVLPMWVADMDFPVADPIWKAIKKRAEHPIFGYAFRSDRFGEVAADWVKKRHGWNISASTVTFSPGIVPAISAAVQAFTKEGDGVIIQAPVYYPFASTITACKRKVVENPLIFENGRYRMDYAGLEKVARLSGAKLLIFCNPHNPVGRVYKREELENLGQVCLQNKIQIFSDEIHSDLILNGHKHTPLAALSPELSQITLTGIAPSKTFNLAGLQTAAVISENPDMLSAFKIVINMNGIQFPNVFGLTAFEAAYEEGETYLTELLAYLNDNMKYALQFFARYLSPLRTVKPEGTYLLWIDCRELGLDNDELERFFHDKAGIGLDAGHWFGKQGDGFMRMNVACPRVLLERALYQLKKALNQ